MPGTTGTRKPTSANARPSWRTTPTGRWTKPWPRRLRQSRKGAPPHPPQPPPRPFEFFPGCRPRSREGERDLLTPVARAGKHDGIVLLLYPPLGATPPCLEYECVEGGDLTGV